MTTEQENELLCEKLLGWKRHKSIIDLWILPGDFSHFLPAFDTWADCGLLLDAMAKRGVTFDINFTSLLSGPEWDIELFTDDEHMQVLHRPTALEAIRSAALAYVQAVQGE